MDALSEQAIARTRAAVLAMLDEHGPSELTAALQTAHRTGASRAAVSRAITGLVNNGQVILTPERTLIPAP
ncbi:hypothetical protein BKG82_27055 [Mycobacteroides chelonae]|uniref:HTH iclR-type domain-containing protein n=1 Tax=Mycobacteroides chelonae TaxID=1774 RepID=A0A1S1LCD4_MYCCH|nr:hypothetical protein [Mycobacteroides chelonae]OHU47313.1 hypothetical protein BKG82_27055 [Mycobacteroides chelonae]